MFLKALLRLRVVRLLPLLRLRVDGVEVDVLSPMPTIFDMREDFASEGSIRVVTHYIGDEDEKVGEIRAMAEIDEDEEHEMVSIIIDSELMHPYSLQPGRVQAGGLVRKKEGRFFKIQDAQGSRIATQGKREVRNHPEGQLGKEGGFSRERVTISDAVSQPFRALER